MAMGYTVTAQDLADRVRETANGTETLSTPHGVTTRVIGLGLLFFLVFFFLFFSFFCLFLK